MQSSSSNDASTTRADNVRAMALVTAWPPADMVASLQTEAPLDIEYDAIIIGSGMGGLATAAKMVAKGAKVLVLEK